MIREWGKCGVIRVVRNCTKKYDVLTVYWNKGILYCVCGQCLIDSESRRNFNRLRLDALSIPNYVIKKGATHGARHGKTEVQREYHMAWNAWKRCFKKVDSQGEHFTGIHNRFLRDPVHRESQLAIGWSHQKCKERDEFAKEVYFFFLLESLFCHSWFRLQLTAIHCNRRGVCGQNTLTRDSFSTPSSLCTHHIVTQGVARRVCKKHVHPHVIICPSVCCFLALSSSSVSRASTFSLTSTCSLS